VKPNLYGLSTTGAEFTTYCGGNGGDSDDESCVLAAKIPGTTDGYVLRSNVSGGEGTDLRADRTELRNLVFGMASELGLIVTDATA
jgi:hypothetical protein